MKYIITIVIVLLQIIGISFADNFPYNGNYNTTNGRTMLIGPDSASNKISKKYLGEVIYQQHPISHYISKFLNYFLVMLAFFTFLVIIWGASMTFTGKTDEGVKKGVQYMKMGIIVIIIIGVSWLISMFIFSIYNSGVK